LDFRKPLFFFSCPGRTAGKPGICFAGRRAGTPGKREHHRRKIMRAAEGNVLMERIIKDEKRHVPGRLSPVTGLIKVFRKSGRGRGAKDTLPASGRRRV